MNYYDVSMRIWQGMPVYPGDPHFNLKWLNNTTDKFEYILSMFAIGSHCGTHVDSPKHFIKDGQPVNELGIDKLCGKAKLFYIENTEVIRPKDLYEFEIEKGDILIIKTDNSEYIHREKLIDHFTHLTREAAEYLRDKGIKAFGFDYITVDINDDFPVHKVFLGAGIPIVEGLDLYLVEPGEYFFVGLPLKIEGAEASPIRAVLIKE
ncbi:cyclase family protein [Calorimonas adulescens]|uniref:Kynurenine formamidase n=2 Tax=Calorimonas adulescens TaxID=2606906 RepID=A0A5D8QH59_9THEO|nr:cyclase family protein [Calorimonas adulescens]